MNTHTQNPQIILLANALLRRAKLPPGSPVLCTQASRWKACVSEYTDVCSLHNLIKAWEIIIKITTGKKLYIRSLICKSTTLCYQVQHLIHSENSASHYARPIVVWACVSASMLSPQAQFVFVFSSNPADRCWLFWVGGVWCQAIHKIWWKKKNLSNFITDILRCTAVEKHIGIFPIWINALAFSPVFDPKYAMCSLIRKNEMNQYAQQIWLTSACIVLLESFLSCVVFGFGLNETFPHDRWIDYHKCLLTESPHGSSLTFDSSQLLVSGMSRSLNRPTNRSKPASLMAI